MRKFYSILLFGFISASAIAQLPQKMSFQSVIRNSSNQLVTSHAVGMRVSILQGSATGTAVYVETQTPTTNINGLVTLEIGNGTPVTGTFAGIDWSTGIYYIKTETDPNGGTSYTITGTSQLLSVPYSLYSKSSASSVDAVKLTGNQTISGNKTFVGTTTVITPVNANDAANKEYVDKMLSIIQTIQTGVRDIDGNTYKVILIGNQLWMSENLRTTKYRNGDLIGTTTPATLDISGESTPKYQWAYGGNESNAPLYGRFYTWYALTDSRNICPAGWHIPTDAEWTFMTINLTNNGYGFGGSGDDIGKSLAATSGWITDPTAGNVGNDQISNNSSGFNGISSGYRNIGGSFSSLGYNCYWWSSTENYATAAWLRMISNSSNNITQVLSNESHGRPVRCLRD
jgi:uncharacterized protein (TIGR02145 family)